MLRILGMTIEEKKKALRKEMHLQRNSINQELKTQYDQWICNSMLQIIEEKQINIVHSYLPMGSEIDIYPLLELLLQKSILVIAPKALPKRKLENRILKSLTELENGVMGTKHPATTQEYTEAIDLIIVPGLAFNREGFRLGYGGGYYDNFLNLYPNALKIGIFYPFQEVEDLPTESHDYKLDKILFKPF